MHRVDTPRAMLDRFLLGQELMLLVGIFDQTCYQYPLAVTGTGLITVSGTRVDQAEVQIGRVIPGKIAIVGVAEAITQVRLHPHGLPGVTSLIGRMTGILQSLRLDGILLATTHRRR